MQYFKIPFLGFLFLGLSISVMAQSPAPKVLSPVPITGKALSGVGMTDRALKNEPERRFFQENLFWGEDIGVFVVGSETWTSEMDPFPFDEFLFVLNGRAHIAPADGGDHWFRSGEFFFAPKGYTGSWSTEGGPDDYYELSVITTKRTDSTVQSRQTVPFLLDRDKVSGIGLAEGETAGAYREVLAQGVELEVVIEAERARSVAIEEPMQEQLVRVLAGQLSITDAEGEEQAFHPGDFFVLPAGFTGKWESNGHPLCRFLRIQKAKG